MRHQASFSELREAIRQGQAKIAQGLKTGQMRSDRQRKTDNEDAVQRAEEPIENDVSSLKIKDYGSAQPQRQQLPVNPAKKPFLPAYKRAVNPPALASKKNVKPIEFSFVFSKTKAFFQKTAGWFNNILSLLGSHGVVVLRSMALVLGLALVVLAVYWIGKGLFYGMPDRPSVPQTAVKPDTTANQQARPVAQTPTDRHPITPPQLPATPSPAPPAVAPTAQRPTPVPPPQPAPVLPAVPSRTGDNVIVIQGIASSRESELKPVQDFFARYGIATEIIRRNNYSLLATQQRFENPDRPGTNGYEMKQKIRQLGKRYPAETGDSKFGAEPFKDAYGMLKPN